MRRLALLLLCIIFSISASAQENIYFNLKSDGAFYINESKVDTILTFPGLSAQQLYNKVKSSLIKVYNNPDVVISENAPISLSVFPLVSDWCRINPIGNGFVYYSSNYTLLFHFKDGRIKIDAPKVNDELHCSGSGLPLTRSFTDLIGRWNKTEKTYAKNKAHMDAIEAAVNLAIVQVVKDLYENPDSDAEAW